MIVLEIHPFDKGRIQVANVYRNEVTPLRERELGVVARERMEYTHRERYTIGEVISTF